MGDIHSILVFVILALFMPVFWVSYLKHMGKDVRLWLVSAFLVGFCTMFGGTYGALMNLYLLKLGMGADVIGQLNGGFFVGMALLAAVSGWIVRLAGGIRNCAVLGMVLVALGQMAFPAMTLLGSEPSQGWLLATLMISSGGLTLYAVNIWPFMASRLRPEKRKYGFSGHLGLVPIGGMVGTALSGRIATWLEGGPDAGVEALATTLALSGLLLLLAVAVLAAIPKQPLITGESGKLSQETPPGTPAAIASAMPVPGAAAPVALIAMMVVVMIFDVSGEGIGRVFKNVYMATDLQLDTAMITMLISYGQLVAALAVFSTPWLIDRLGLSWTFILTTLGMSFGLAVVSGIPNWVAAGGGYALLIGFSQMARAAKTQYAMEIVEERYRAHISGWMQFAETGTVFSLSVLGGHALEHWQLGFANLFNIVALSTAFAALLFWVFFVRRPPVAVSGGLPRPST